MAIGRHVELKKFFYMLRRSRGSRHMPYCSPCCLRANHLTPC